MTNQVQKRSNATKLGDWYDYPQYYDLAFAEDTPVEADFIEAIAKKYAVGPVRRMLEPGCGGGRLVAELAKRGYHVIGFDDNQRSIDYLAQKIARGKLSAEAIIGDMTVYKTTKQVDVAFNTFNTFRHLTTDEAALKHLQQTAKSVRKGGLYVLGFHLFPDDASEECIERWRAERGTTKVTYTLRVLDCNRKTALERLRVTMLVRRPNKELRLATEFTLRLYNLKRWRELLSRVPEWGLCDTYDFLYDPETPVKLDNKLSDAIFILRRR